MKLIDADKLKRKMQKIATETWKMKLTGGIRVETIWNQAIDLIEAQPTVNQWIPVTSELPEDDEWVLVTYCDRIEMMKWDLMRGCFYDCYARGHDRDEVLAWQSLPKPYKE